MSMWKILRMGYGIGNRLSNRLQNNLTTHINSTASKAKISGYILANDRVGYDQVGLKDYSSLALPSDFNKYELESLSQGAMSLGKFLTLDLIIQYPYLKLQYVISPLRYLRTSCLNILY